MPTPLAEITAWILMGRRDPRGNLSPRAPGGGTGPASSRSTGTLGLELKIKQKRGLESDDTRALIVCAVSGPAGALRRTNLLNAAVSTAIVARNGTPGGEGRRGDVPYLGLLDFAR